MIAKDESNEQKSILMSAKDIQFGYKKDAPLLKGVDLSISPGEIIGISGENGTGKSTLLKIIVGLLSPQKGELIQTSKVGYSPQNLLLFDNLTVLENFRVFGKGMDMSEKEINLQAKEIMIKLNFERYSGFLIKNLSGGTKQKVNFGISLLGDPNILVLDEPYQGMDYASFSAFWEIQFEMRKKGKAIIIVSHMIEDQSKFTRSLHLIDGKLRRCGKDCTMNCEP